MERITAISNSSSDPTRRVIKVDGKSVATLSRQQVEALKLEVELAWTDVLSRRVQDAAAFDKTMKKALQLINRRPLSEAQLSAKLRESGIDGDLISRAMVRLRGIGAVDDESLGDQLIDELIRNKSAGPRLLRAKLRQRGLAKKLVDKLVTERSAASSFEDALDLAKQRLRRLRRVPPPSRGRKLAGLLARRGYDEETVERVIVELKLDGAGE